MEQNKKYKQVKKAISVICTINKLNEKNNNIQFKKTFTIPPYQRLYAWKDEQIKALLDDFRNCIEHNNKQEDESNEKSHFIGNVVVAKKEEKNELIDGQQRLTTIWLVLRYLLKKDFKAEDYFDIEMPIREEDIQAINEYCGSNNKDLDECFNDANNTNAGFKNAFKFFEAYFSKDGKDLKKEFINFIKKEVKFNLVILSDQVELNKYFVRMNNTGVQLDGTDILKARLLEKIHSDENTQNEVTKYARIFDECSQMNYFSDFGFVNNSENNNMIGESQKIEKIIQWHKISKKEDKKKERAEFESIIDFPTFVLHVFKILSRQELKEGSDKKIFKIGTQISIKKDKFLENTWDCLEFNNNCGAKIAIKIISALKDYRIIFDTFVIKRKSDDDENVYKLWNRFKKNDKNIWDEVKDDKKDDLKNLAIIQNYLRVARRGDNANYHHFLTHYLEFCKNEIVEKQKEITNENCLDKLKDNDNADNLRKYLKNIDDFLACKMIEDGSNLIYTLKDFENKPCEKQNINFDFLNYNNRGNYKINLTYWFHRLEYYLLIGNYYTNQELGADFKEKFEKYKSGYYFRNINSVEHILAQHEEEQTNNKIDKNVLHSFGNLALISSSENSSLSNQGYEKKRIDFNNNKIISLKLFDVFKNEKYKEGKWLSKQIKDHQNAMLKVLQKSFENT
ncbi:DUF262 domain-containing protein [Campylobacter sp. MG1]|uniref:DUF262 domain-containing protein n=1 Tax=Campylobacter sp. MG1 TaxID=2976332 RepID=UPI00226D28E7|nr:DUF262 domain-containing protein [Campylobacter sp. MG1]